MKKLISNIIYRVLYLIAGSSFSNKNFNYKTLIKYFLWQKILRINYSIKWPVHYTSQIKSPEKIKRGNRNPGMSIGCYIDGRNAIIFGNNVWVGPNVSIISMNHDLNNFNQYIKKGPIIIGDDCWLATNCVLLPGVKLGNHVIVAAGAVVTKSFEEDNIVIGGNPAKIIKRIGKYES